MADLVKREGAGSAAETPAPSAEAAGASTLRRNALSMPEVLAQSVANMAPTAAMALLPLLVFVSAGNGTWLSFVIATVLMVCVGYCASQFARRMNSAGSLYVWVTRGLRSGTGHTSGWALRSATSAQGWPRSLASESSAATSSAGWAYQETARRTRPSSTLSTSFFPWPWDGGDLRLHAGLRAGLNRRAGVPEPRR
jgi:amino acid transporter